MIQQWTSRSKAWLSGRSAPRAATGVGFVVVLILVVAFLLRSIGLDLKPVHFDEGINGNFVHGMWRDGYYPYDPKNFHGPLYFYVLLFAELIFGKTIFAYRFINAIIAAAGIYLIARHRRFFPGRATTWAAWLAAIGTAAVFYSRYAIHETFFVFCQILFSFAYFLWREEKSRRAMAAMVASVVGAIALKETFFIFYLTWIIAIVCARVAERIRPRLEEASKFKSSKDRADDKSDEPYADSFWLKRATFNDWIIAGSLGLWALLLIFTGFFLNPRGFQDMFAAFAIWTKTGTGNSGHEKPFIYWLEMMWRYEWPSLIALVSVPIVVWCSGFRARVLAFTSFGIWLAYSLIPYKTPWLILNQVWLFAFVFGFMWAEIANWRSHLAKGAARAVMLISIGASVSAMLALNFKDYANEREPYVYVQSTNAMKTALDTIFIHLKKRPEDLNLKTYLLVRDPWPLPWLFGDFPNLIYARAEDADLANAGIVLIDESARPTIESKLKGKFWRVPFRIRDAYEGGFIYLDFARFLGSVPSDTPVFEGEPR